MRPTTQKTTLARVGFDRSRTTKSPIGKSRVLIKEMCIFGSTSLSKVPDLHNLWEESNVHCGLCRLREVMTFEYFFILSDGFSEGCCPVQKRHTWWNAPLCQYFCKNFCCPFGFSSLLFCARSRSSFNRTSSGSARRRSISALSSSRLTSASFSRLIRPNSRSLHASNSAVESRPSVSSTSGT
jgi:hypothetical protein